MLALALTLALAAPPDLATTFEKSGGLKTGRYDEVVRLCSDFVSAFPGKARCDEIGITPEGRPMLALIASEDGALTPELARAKHRPVVMFQGGIHAGEIDGKDAGFVFVREMLDGTAAKNDKSLKDALSKVTLVFVPVFNVDGSERVTKFNRPNQRGPEEMGWRVTSQNLNLNRDYTKADAPEMQSMLRALDAWDPAIYLDLHVTDGAKFQHDVSVLIAPLTEGLAPADLVAKAEALRKEVGPKLEKQKHLPITEFYPSFRDGDDPASGFDGGVAPPRFSQFYWATRNRIGILVETHSWKDYATRVRATHDVLADVTSFATREASSLLAVEKAADAESAQLGGHEVALVWSTSGQARQIEFKGYAWTREKSDLSGGTWVRYDETKPQVWKVPFYEALKPVVTVKAPKAGYVISAGYAKLVIDRLRLHAIELTVLSEPRTGVAVEAYRASAKLAPATFEGRARESLAGEWKAETVDLPAGSIFIPIAQPRARTALHLLEPSAPDSFAAWGFFAAAFEQKEYIEDYVAEEMAREMLAKDPALKAEFEKKVAADKEFAASPEARLDFFYQRSPYYDARANQYPVMRVDKAP